MSLRTLHKVCALAWLISMISGARVEAVTNGVVSRDDSVYVGLRFKGYFDPNSGFSTRSGIVALRWEGGVLKWKQRIVRFDNCGTVNGLNDVGGIVISPDGKYLYAQERAWSPDTVSVLERQADGTLKYLTSVNNHKGNFLAVSPDGQSIYSTNAFEAPDHLTENGIYSFERDSGTGMLVADGVTIGDLDGDGINDLINNVPAVSPDGPDPDDRGFVYVPGGNGPYAIGIFQRDPADVGKLNFIDKLSFGSYPNPDLCIPYGAVVSPDAHDLYVASTCSQNVVGFHRYDSSGAFLGGDIQQFQSLKDPSSFTNATFIAISPDGEYLYVTAPSTPGGSTLTVLHRNKANGELSTAIDVEREGVDSGCGVVEGLNGVGMLAVDQGHVYAFGVYPHEDAFPETKMQLAVFTRNPADGKLCFASAVDLRDPSPHVACVPTPTPIVTPTEIVTPTVIITPTETITPNPGPIHDSVLQIPKQLDIHIDRGKAHASAIGTLRVTNADASGVSEGGGHAIQLTVVLSGDCPDGLTIGPVDFLGPGTDTAMVVPGNTKTAHFTVTAQAANFTCVKPIAPHRCTLLVEAKTAGIPAAFEPTAANNVAPLEVNIYDKNDPVQPGVHETFTLNGPQSADLVLKDGVFTKSISQPNTFRIGNADLDEAAGHSVNVGVSSGTCPMSLAPSVDSPVIVPGNSSKAGKLKAIVSNPSFATSSNLSPARCIVEVSAIGPVGDLDPSNNTTFVVVDVVDKNDF